MTGRVHHVGLDADGAVRVTTKPQAAKAPRPGKPITLAAAMRDVRLLGGPFQAPSFWTWMVIAKLFSGEELDEREADPFRRCTGRTKLPDGPIKTLIFLSGRRSGKDRFMSALAIWLSALAADWRSLLSAGEDAVVILLGSDFKQARILRRYCQGLIETPMLAALVTRATEQRIEFRNGAVLEIATNDASLVRGRSAIGILGTEVSFWETDDSSKSSDEEVIAAATPSMSMIPSPGGLLMMSSSVHRKAGFMHRQWKELHANDESEDICWLSPSATMNEMIPASVIEKAIRNDPMRAKADYLSIWRDDINSFLDLAIIESAVDPGVTARPPRKGVVYHCGLDPSGGAKDSFTAAIAHADKDNAIVLDALLEIRAPFEPSAAVEQIVGLLDEYGLKAACGDKYAAMWVVSAFAKHGITYRHSERDRSKIFLDTIPLFTSGRARILDNKRCVMQWANLERKTSSLGRDVVTHGVGGMDDVCNSASLAMVLAGEAPSQIFWSILDPAVTPLFTSEETARMMGTA